MRPKRNMVLAVPTTTIGFFLAHSGLNVIFIALYQQNMRNLKLFSKLIPMVENSSCYSAEVSKCADKENYHSFFILPLSVFIWFAICLSLIVLTPAKSNQDEHHEEDDGKHLKEFLACWQGIKIEQLVSFCRKLHTGRNLYFGFKKLNNMPGYNTQNIPGQYRGQDQQPEWSAWLWGSLWEGDAVFFYGDRSWWVRSDFEKETRWRWLLLFMRIADLW